MTPFSASLVRWIKSAIFVLGWLAAVSAQAGNFSLIDLADGMVSYSNRCSSCHGSEPSYLQRGPSADELSGRAQGDTGHGGGRTPFEGITVENLAAYFSSLDTNRYSVSGAVVDVQGNGLPGIEVVICSTYLGYEPRRSLTADDGGFRFDGLPPGDHQVTPSSPPFLFAPAKSGLKAIRFSNFSSALLVGYPTNEPPPLTTPAGMVLRVQPNGDDLASGRAWAAAKRTIGAALAAVPSGGEVWVAEGTYHEILSVQNRRLLGGFSGTEIRRDQRDWVSHPTIIDADPEVLLEQGIGPNSVVTMSSEASESATCDGLTVQYGSAANGGGILISAGCSAHIDHCHVRWNSAASTGGGIFCDQLTSLTLTHSILEQNMCPYGGAIFGNIDSAIELSDNLFVGNSAGSAPGLFSTGLVPRMVNNTFVLNSGDDGSAAVIQWDATGINANNIVAFNSGGIDSSGTEANWHHNAVFGNTNSNWGSLAPGPTDIQIDPRFRDSDQGDYHLLPGSPCRDGGDDTLAGPGDIDLDQNPRQSRRHVDLGAYELPAPKLSMERAGGQLRVTWPGNETGFVLEQSSDFTSSLWQIAPPPSLVDGDWSVFIPPVARQTFYRLTQP